MKKKFKLSELRISEIKSVEEIMKKKGLREMEKYPLKAYLRSLKNGKKEQEQRQRQIKCWVRVK